MGVEIDRIDRIAPSSRPEEKAVMYQSWRKLLFLHWEIDAEVLRPLVPESLELDLFEGKAFIGLVPFTMFGVRPTWSRPYKWLSDFHETNVRTYVVGPGGSPGVWFFSLEAARLIAVLIARLTFHLPYYYAKMSIDEQSLDTNQQNEPSLRYQSRRLWSRSGAGCEVVARPIGEAAPRSLAESSIS